jgi:hypothetical protein
MSSSKSIAAARARRSGEQQQQQQRPNTSIASAKAFNPQQPMSQQPMSQQQQMPPQQQQQQRANTAYGQPGGKISISDAIGLTTIRLGKVEKFIQQLQEEGGLNSNFEIPDNAQLIDKSVIANIISRIDSLEKRDGTNMNEKIGRLETEIRSIRDLLNNTKSSFDTYVQSNEKRFEDIETAFVDLEQNLVVHDTPTDEIVNNNLGTSTEISDNNVQLIIDEK